MRRSACCPVCLKEVDVAKGFDAWILCDEVYRGLDENLRTSIADFGYDKAISLSSVSKMFSMAIDMMEKVRTLVTHSACFDMEKQKRSNRKYGRGPDGPRFCNGSRKGETTN